MMIEIVIKIPEEKYKAITEMYETFPKDMKDWGLEAIKNAPTVEMAEDCISREAVIEGVIKCTDMNEDTMEVLEDKVRALQSVIPKTEWIPIKTRPLTEEEKEHYISIGWSKDSLEFMYDCQLPDDMQEVLITDSMGNVELDTFCSDDGCYFEVNCDADDVIAWMPLPEPYKAGNKTKQGLAYADQDTLMSAT